MNDADAANDFSLYPTSDSKDVFDCADMVKLDALVSNELQSKCGVPQDNTLGLIMFSVYIPGSSKVLPVNTAAI